MNIKKSLLANILIFTLITQFSCNSSNPPQTKKGKAGNEVLYAKGFSMSDSAGNTYIEVYNPWSGYNILQRYIFTENPGLKKNNEGVTVIQIPVEKAAYLSSTFLGMVALTKSFTTVGACSNANWIYDSTLYSMYLDGKITDLGNDMTVNPEALVSKHPDIVMKYIYKSEDPVDKIISGAGIPIIYNIEFMEQHPLGRAEWIKLVGAMTGKKRLADSIFNQIVENYNHFVSLTSNIKTKPKVLHGSNYKGTWYVAGGKSYIAQLLNDAGADYYWFSDSTAGSIPVSFENVILNQRDAEVWIGANAHSLEEIVKIEPRCEIFEAFRKKNVYHYNKRLNPNGGIDYYESGVVRPDLLLRDFLLILHPSLFNESEETTYWKKLE
jgi:iron complex transport system substrate-binding protein